MSDSTEVKDGILRITSFTTSADAAKIRQAGHVHDMRGGETCVKRRSMVDPCPLAPSTLESLLTRQMEAVTETREGINALVQALVADGFSDEQARDIVAGMWRTVGKKSTDD